MKASVDSPVYGFLKNPSLVDYPNRYAAVFFVSGCNFRCGFCHNPELLEAKSRRIGWDRLAETCRAFSENWVNGAVITGGEPTLAPGLPDLIEFFKGLGWAVKLDTNGWNAAVLEACLPILDYTAMDVKADRAGYEELTGFADVERIAESVAVIKDQAADHEFRTTIIQDFHTDGRMRGIGSLIEGARRYVMQPFVPREGLPDPAFESMARTSPDRMRELEGLMRPYAREVCVRGASSAA